MIELLNTINWISVGIFLLGTYVLYKFFQTKSTGYGKYTTSVLIILLVLIITSLLFSSKLKLIDKEVFVNILFAIIGFAVGLFTDKQDNKNSK